MRNDGILLIDHGDAPSLAALALEAEPARVMLWPAIQLKSAGAAAAALRAAREHGEIFSVRQVLAPADVLQLAGGLGSDQARSRSAIDSILLLRAIELAAAHGCPKVIWPVAVGPSVEDLSNAVQRAQLVTALMGLGGTQRAPVIDMPVADLADSHIVDILEDVGAPLAAFWPCDGTEPVAAEGTRSGSSEPCGRCSGCRRWMAAFDATRVEWPWQAAAAC